MKKLWIALVVSAFAFGGVAYAKKPDNPGHQGQSPEKQMRSEHTTRTERGDARNDDEDRGDRVRDENMGRTREHERERLEKRSREQQQAPGREKNRERKSEQERKEMGKGSEQGQKSRQEHSRKWWQFWK